MPDDHTSKIVVPGGCAVSAVLFFPSFRGCRSTMSRIRSRISEAPIRENLVTKIFPKIRSFPITTKTGETNISAFSACFYVRKTFIYKGNSDITHNRLNRMPPLK